MCRLLVKSRKTNKAKRIDPSCRNHGSCPACKANRLHQSNKALKSTEDQEKAFDELVKEAQELNLGY